MRFWMLGAVLILTAAVIGCGGGGSSSASVTISPSSTTVIVSGTVQFTGTVAGVPTTDNDNDSTSEPDNDSDDNLVTWSVCNPPSSSDTTGTSNASNTLPTGCGNAALGTVSSTGLYTAPAAPPNPPTVSVVATDQKNTKVFAIAVVTIDSGVRVTVSPSSAVIGTGEHFQFSDTVTGTSNTAVTWSVNGVTGGDSSVGTVSSTGLYTAPTSPLPSGATIEATSAADTRQSGSASASVFLAADPTLTTLDPSTAAEGSVQQEVFLGGTNFFSTSTVLVNNIAFPTTFVNSTALSATIPSNLLNSATTLSVTVERQNGDTAPPLPLTVVPVRPAVVSSSPDDDPQNSTSGNLSITGGYFSPSTTVQFNGQARAASLVNSRQLNVALNSADFSTAGLFSFFVQNTDVPAGSPSLAAGNLAIVPPTSTVPSAPVATFTVGSQPSAVAIDPSTGTAVVVNHGDVPGTVSLINLDSGTVSGPVTVGKAPTGVAVDDQLHLAAVVNSADNSVSVIDLNSGTVTSTLDLPTVTSGTTPAPYSVGINPLTHRGLVAEVETNMADVVDFSTNPPSVVCVLGGTKLPNSCAGPNNNTLPVSTGSAPSIAIEPRLNWAIVTPGGSGTITIVDLGTPVGPGQAARSPNVIATLTLSISTRGIALNTETEQALVTDPDQSQLHLFSVLDQVVTQLNLDTGEVAAAVNPLTDVGVTVNDVSNQATVLDLRSLQTIQTVNVGTTPQAVAIDPGTNEAVVANEGGNNVSVLSLGPIRSLEVAEINPATTFTSSSPLAVTVTGHGFLSGAFLRLDGTQVPTTVNSNGRQLTATIPANLLGQPRRFAVDVENSNGTLSNVTDLAVLGAVPVGANPEAVAIDPGRDLAIVTNMGDCQNPGSVSIVDLASGSVTGSVGVGTCPQGVAVLPRLGRAVVANGNSNNASIVDYVGESVLSTLPVGGTPMGVAIQPDTAVAAIANSGSNTVSLIAVDTGTSVAAIPVDQRPVAVGIDPIDNLAAVAASTQNTLDIINLGTHLLTGRVNFFQNPTGVAFDPVSDSFIVANSSQNDVVAVNPTTLLATPINVGIQPTSVDYNFQSSTLVTFNDASQTMSVMDFLGQKVRAVLPLSGSPAFTVAIDPLTNLAAVVDNANNRLLLVPLPH